MIRVRYEVSRVRYEVVVELTSHRHKQATVCLVCRSVENGQFYLIIQHRKFGEKLTAGVMREGQ